MIMITGSRSNDNRLSEQDDDDELVATDLRASVFELAEALFQSIRMQLSVERYKAIRTSRGANLEDIDKPLNNREDFKESFDDIRKLKSEEKRLDTITKIVD